MTGLCNRSFCHLFCLRARSTDVDQTC